MSDDCHELKNIKYQTMLLNGNNNISSNKPQASCQINMESFMEQDKQKQKNKTWSKLDNGVRIKKLRDFSVYYAKEHKLTKLQKTNLKAFLLKSLQRKKLQKTKEVEYDVEEGKIIKIPALNYNKDKKKFTLKRLESDVSNSISNRLAPKTIKKRRKNAKTKKAKAKELIA